MNTDIEYLWRDTLSELSHPDIVWQLLALLACLALAKFFEGRVRERVTVRVYEEKLRGSLKRVMFPLVAFLLVLLTRHLLRAQLHTHLLSLALPLLLSLAVIRLVAYILRHSFGNAPWLAPFERLFALLAWGVVALHILGWLPEVIDFLSSIELPLGSSQITLWQMLQASVTVAATVLGALWLSNAFEARLDQAAEMDVNLRIVLGRISRALLTLIAILLSLPLVGINLTTLSVFGGALGVGLGFGLQKIASNYVSGFIILLERSIRPGNVISLGEDRGVVSEITTRYTVLRSVTGVEYLVPNDLMISSVVRNEAYTDRNVWLSLPVQVSYDSDLDLALRLLREAAQSQSRVLTNPAPESHVVQFADSGIDLLLGFWIADPESGSLGLKSEINLAIWREFRKHGIVIPFPQREVRLLTSDMAQKNG